METIAESSILLHWNYKHESINPTPRDTNKNHNDESITYDGKTDRDKTYEECSDDEIVIDENTSMNGSGHDQSAPQMRKQQILNDSLQPILQRESTIGMSEHYKQYSSETSKFDCEISSCILIFYDKVLELYFTQFIEMKSSLSLNISMIFMRFGGLLLSAMNSSFMELLESFFVGAISLIFMFALLSLSTYNQNKMLNDADILDKPIENELELKNATNSNDNSNTKILTLTLSNNENNISNKKKKW